MARIAADNSRRLAATAVVLAAFAAALAVVLQVVIWTDDTYTPHVSPGRVGFNVLLILTFATVGSVVALKVPGNAVGWVLLFIGGSWLFGEGVMGAYAVVALLARPEAELPLGLHAVSISGAAWVPQMAGVFLLLILFPRGRLPSARWRPVVAVTLVTFTVVWLGLVTAPVGVGVIEHEPPFEEFKENPFNPIADERYMAAVLLLIPICLVSIAAAVVNLLIRFYRSTGEERAQFKWLALAAGLLAAGIPLGGSDDDNLLTTISNVVFVLGLLGLPVAIGVAVLRYRLYDIDRIINRTLVYAVVTATLAVTYFAFVVGLQALLRPINGGSDLAIVATTLLVAALFLPLRSRIQRAVDRRFNRRSYNAALTIEAFSARLREQIDLDTLRYELLGVTDKTMSPARVSLWLRDAESVR